MILSLQNLYLLDPSLSWLVWVQFVDSISPLASKAFSIEVDLDLVAHFLHNPLGL